MARVYWPFVDITIANRTAGMSQPLSPKAEAQARTLAAPVTWRAVLVGLIAAAARLFGLDFRGVLHGSGVDGSFLRVWHRGPDVPLALVVGPPRFTLFRVGGTRRPPLSALQGGPKLLHHG